MSNGFFYIKWAIVYGFKSKQYFFSNTPFRDIFLLFSDNKVCEQVPAGEVQPCVCESQRAANTQTDYDGVHLAATHPSVDGLGILQFEAS